MRPTPPDLAVGILTLAFAAFCAAFVWQPTLASFADDSVSYLVMAQVFSPYQRASDAVAAAFSREAFYPPLFPLLLALAGAAHDIAWAHALSALVLAASLPWVYALGVRWLDNRWAAALAAMCVALLPSMWVNTKGILSEPLFCALLLASLWVVEREGEGRRKTGILAVLFAAMALTRAAGLIMVGFHALWASTRRGRSWSENTPALWPAASACIAYAAWIYLRPAETADDYMRVVLELIRGTIASEHPWAALGDSLLRQATAVAEAWVGSLVVFWVEGRPLRLILAATVGCLALAGLALRLRAGKADAWMMAGYLALYLAWPFYAEMGRYLFPVLPVLVLYAFQALAAALRALGRPAGLAHGLIALLMLSLTVPAMAFIQQRASAQGRYPGITDWYRTPDLAEARARADVHLNLFADMEAIKALTRPEHRVMWVAPAYVALLADRRGIRAPAAGLSPDDYRRAVQQAMPDYVFLSAYHPRDTLDDTAWRTGMRALDGYGAIVHARTRAGGTIVTSVLIRAE